MRGFTKTQFIALFSQITSLNFVHVWCTKIILSKCVNLMTWRDLIPSLRKAKDLDEFLYEGKNAHVQEHQNETKASFLIKKNTSLEVYCFVRNLTRLHEIRTALRNYFGSKSKRNVQTRKRSLRKVTI